MTYQDLIDAINAKRRPTDSPEFKRRWDRLEQKVCNDAPVYALTGKALKSAMAEAAFQNAYDEGTRPDLAATFEANPEKMARLLWNCST